MSSRESSKSTSQQSPSGADAPLRGRCVAVLATDGVEQVELMQPVDALRAAGAEVHIVSLRPGEIQGVNHEEKGDRIHVDRTLDEAKARDYHALVIPGGVANPDTLRTDERAVAFVRHFIEFDKPVAAICHGPWLLVEADAVRGRTLTSWPSLRTDIRNAGGEWEDREVVTDQKLVTSRKPADLPAFCEQIVAAFASAAEESSIDRAVEQTFPASDPVPWMSSTATIGKTAERRQRPRDEPRPDA